MRRLLNVISLICLLSSLILPLYGQWLPTNGPYRDEITAFLARDSALYLGTTLSGIFRSSDGGSSWQAANGDQGFIGVTGVAAIGDTLFAGEDYRGVSTSTDRGEHWVRLLPGYIYRGDYVGVHDGRLFVGAGSILWMSTNRGSTWTTIGPSVYPAVNYIQTMATFGSNLVVGTDNGFAVSTDLGATWSRGDSGIVRGQGGISVASLFRFGGSLLAGTSSGAYISQDSARTWTLLDSLFLTRRVTGWALIDSTLFAGTSTAGIFRRQGPGGGWSRLSPGPAAAGILNLTVHGRTLYAGTEDGLYVSSDQGEHWEAHWLNTRLAQCPLLASASTETGSTVLFAASGANLYRSSDVGESWARAYTGLPGHTNVTAIVRDGTVWYASSSGSGVYRSVDGGMTWQPVGPKEPPAAVNTLAVVRGTVIAGTPQGVYRLAEGAGEWSTPDSGFGAVDVRALLAFHDTVLAGAGYEGYTFISTDKGAHWKSTGPTWGLYRPTMFAAWGGTLLACTYLPSSEYPYPVAGAVFRSIDVGASWRRVDTPTMGLPITIAADSTGLYVGYQASVLYSSNFGFFWKTWDKPPAMGAVRALAVGGKYLFAGGDVGWVYRRVLPPFVTGIATGSEEVPGKIALLQNYPNPFNPATMIRYALPARLRVSLAVFNTLGQKVAELVDGDVEAGSHAVRFDAGGLASGVYFCRLQAGGKVLSRAMVIVR